MNMSTYSVPSVTYANGVTLYSRTADGWPVSESDGTRHIFPSIPAFMAWCSENYTWPMPSMTGE